MFIVTGVFNNRTDAKEAIRTLGRSGFLAERLSIAASDAREFRRAVAQLFAKDDSKFTVWYGLAGATLGAALGVYASIALPAAHILAGTPLFSGLIGVVLGTMFGTLTGFVFDLSTQDYRARVRKDALTAARIMVCVRTSNQTERFSAEAILEEWGTVETFVKAVDASKIDVAT